MAQAPILVSLLAVDLGWRIDTTIVDDAIQVNKSATWSPTDIVNRSSPIQTYSSSGPMEFSFTFNFKAVSNATSEVLEPCKTLMSLVFPIVPGTKPPSKCLINAGNFLKNFSCVCTSVQVSFSDAGWRPDGTPMGATVACSFVEYDIENTPASKWAMQSYKTPNFRAYGGKAA